MTSFLRSDRSTAVALWLFAVAALVFAMVVVGGATRLTGSGLSITEWRPVTGAIPPLSDAAWQAEFARYKAIPQYAQLNAGMGLAGFKSIYWWEWGHRLLGRLVGFAFLLPFLFFLWKRQIPKRLVLRCWGLFALGGLQGAIGWWMVSSGLADRVSVAPERLTVHLGLAFLLFILLVWTGLDAWSGQPRQESVTRWRIGGLVFLAAAFLQSLLGALVAGNDAGLVYPDFPFFNGALVPADYAGGSLWATIAHNQASVQMHHRIGAYLLFIGAIVMMIMAQRAYYLAGQARGIASLIALAVTVQAGLGISTLMAGVPLWLGMLHQAGAVVVLAVATAFAWRVRRL
ncbi:MAG TPA: COX15/CtaA family protein [Caulobacteraceae bacterium]